MNNKRKLMVVLGAGASLELGMPSVTDVDTLFHNWTMPDFTLASDDSRERSKFCVKVHGFPICTHLSGSRGQVREWALQMSSSEDLVSAGADKWGSAFH